MSDKKRAVGNGGIIGVGNCYTTVSDGSGEPILLTHILRCGLQIYHRLRRFWSVCWTAGCQTRNTQASCLRSGGRKGDRKRNLIAL